MVTVATIPEDPKSRPDDTAMAAWRALLRYHAVATRRLDAELRELHDIPIEWYDVLVQLSEHGGHMRMGSLAEATLFSRANCTRIVDRMESRGLVIRTVDPDDHRGRIATLTDGGRRTLSTAARTHLAGIQEVFGARLDDGEAETLAEILDRVAEAE
jgi:DNA-binding MarR family transcriptional regulator